MLTECFLLILFQYHCNSSTVHFFSANYFVKWCAFFKLFVVDTSVVFFRLFIYFVTWLLLNFLIGSTNALHVLICWFQWQNGCQVQNWLFTLTVEELWSLIYLQLVLYVVFVQCSSKTCETFYHWFSNCNVLFLMTKLRSNSILMIFLVYCLGFL